MSVKALNESFSNAKREIKINKDGKEYTFYASKLGYLTAQHIGRMVNDPDKNWMAYLIKEAITDADGNQFTYDEVLRLDADVGVAFQAAVLEANEYLQKKPEGEEKK